MSEVVFETRAISVWHILIFAIISFYIAIGIFALISGIADWSLISIFFVFFGSLFFMFLFSILFSKLKVYEDGISFRMYHVYFDEVDKIRLKWGGRILVLGWKWNWYLLLNPQKFIEVIRSVKPEVWVEYRKPVKRWKTTVYYILLLAPLMMLWGVERILSYIGVAIDAFTWALIWGITAFLSVTAWTYWLPPHRYRILSLGRLGTSIVMGLTIGIPISLIMLTKVFT
jgi:hypothetical protein